MHLSKYIELKTNGVFHVSKKIVWFSSLFIGILASIPKIMQLHITLVEIACILKPFDVKDIEQALNKVKKLKDSRL